jgi:ABC-type dipeptide/oligopeptide/nickel transport system permease subunit
MNINKTSELLNTLLSQTDKKSEKKVYVCFIRALSSLKKKYLTESQSQLIQEKLSSLNLKVTTGNRKKYYKQKLSESKAFLKNEFSFTPAKYYTKRGMVYGMIFGTGISLSIGTAIDPTLGISIGLSIGISVGMVFGMMYGARKDAEAKKQGRTIQKNHRNK